MKRWIVVLVVFVLVFLIGSFIYVYQYGGLKQYVRALSVIETMASEEQALARAELFGTDRRGAQRGIHAGYWMGRVWVWGAGGLKSFVSDEYTLYSWFDGCSDEVRARLNRGEADVIEQVLYNDSKLWRERAEVGDYVAVYVTRPGQGGTVGNVRELYNYNFWLFMNTGIDSECAK